MGRHRRRSWKSYSDSNSSDYSSDYSYDNYLIDNKISSWEGCGRDKCCYFNVVRNSGCCPTSKEAYMRKHRLKGLYKRCCGVAYDERSGCGCDSKYGKYGKCGGSGRCC